MALQFSRVTLYNKTDDSSESFLARGIPREFADLECYTHFDNFIKYLEGITDIDVEVDTFLYGEGESSSLSRGAQTSQDLPLWQLSCLP